MERRLDMRQEIHPEYTEIKATCSCGNVIVIKSTLKEDIKLDVCSACHPFYTGKQKLVDTGGRIERFEKRFGKKGNPKDQNKEDLIKEPGVKAEVPKKAKEEGAPEEIEEKAPEKKVAAKKVTSKKASQKETKPKKESGEK
jgi:large subunit ribosomal protein L31